MEKQSMLFAPHLTQEQNPDKAHETTVSTSSRKIIVRHLSNFLQDNDLDAVVSDYTDESILITLAATSTGTRDNGVCFDGLKQFPINTTLN